MRILVADTETTGTGKADKLVEVAWIELDNQLNILGDFTSLIDPEMHIPADASGVHGIANEDVEVEPTEAELFDIVLKDQDFEDVLLVCHNVAFDERFLSPFMNISKKLCTLRMAKKIYPESPNHKLGTLIFHLGLPRNRDAHRALADVEATVNLLNRIVKDTGKDLITLVEEFNKPQLIKTMPFGKHKGCRLEDIPKNYLSWLIKQDLDSDLKWSLEKLCGVKFK